MSKTGDIFPVKDPVKKTLFMPKLLLEICTFWPEKRTHLTKLINWIMLGVCVFIESGQIAFVCANIRNITKLASAMSTVSTTFQAITKLLVLYFYSNRLKNLLGTIWYKFWPAHFLGPQIYNNLQNYNKIITTAFLVIFTTGAMFSFGFLSSPLRTGTRILPFEAIYPFQWNKSPLYEIIYIIEWLTNECVILVGICGHDYLFIGICSNLVAQYILLKEILSHLGTKNIAEITEKLTDLTKSEFDEKDQNLKLLKICIRHHVLLGDIGREVSEIFSFTSFVQLFSSVTALCVAALIITFAEIDITLFTSVIIYLLGHFLQLFMFCSIGNEVTAHARQFATSVFDNKWYNIENNQIKKDMLFVLRRAQIDVKISAMGLKSLDYQTLIGVLRLSFSFYTMISNITAN